MLSRAIRAALLNRRIYREVADDPEAILSALGIVALVGIAMALGRSGVLVGVTAAPIEVGSFVDRLLEIWLAVMTMMVSWILWAVVIYLLGTRFLGGGAGYRQLIRILGIIYGPGILFLLIPVPFVGGAAFAIGALWVLVAGVVAVREVQQVDWVSAGLSTIVGWFLCLLVLPSVLLGPLPGGA